MAYATTDQYGVPIKYMSPEEYKNIIAETTGGTYLEWDIDYRRRLEGASGTLPMIGGLTPRDPELAALRKGRVLELFPGIVWDPPKTKWYKQTAGKIGLGLAGVFAAVTGVGIWGAAGAGTGAGTAGMSAAEVAALDAFYVPTVAGAVPAATAGVGMTAAQVAALDSFYTVPAATVSTGASTGLWAGIKTAGAGILSGIGSGIAGVFGKAAEAGQDRINMIVDREVSSMFGGSSNGVGRGQAVAGNGMGLSMLPFILIGVTALGAFILLRKKRR